MFLLFNLLTLGAEAAIRKGKCPKITGEENLTQNFDMGKITGTWYV